MGWKEDIATKVVLHWLRNQLTSFIENQLAYILHILRIYPEAFGRMALGVHLGATGDEVKSSTPLRCVNLTILAILTFVDKKCARIYLIQLSCFTYYSH